MKRTAAQVILLLLAVCTVYGPTLKNDYIWDDHTNIYENETLTRPDALRRIWTTDEIYQYYPLTFTSFYLEYLFNGRTFRPEVTHAVNSVLHAANAVVLMFLCRQLGMGVWSAWLVAALFAVHPIETESVAWGTERKNVLSGLFFLGAFLTYARFAGTGGRRTYVLALILFLLAGLSKTVTMTLPVSLLLLERVRERTAPRRILVRLSPFFFASVVFALVARHFEHERAGAAYAEIDLGPIERIIIACRVPWHYLWNILVPRSPVFIPPRWDIDTASVWSYWPVLLTAGSIIFLWSLRRRLPALTLVGAGHFLVTLLPASGLVNFVFMGYSFVQDHFQYLAGVGVLIIVAQVAAYTYDRAERIGARPVVAGALLVLVLGALGTVSHKRCRDYRSSETLWRDTLAKNPAAWMAHYNLGIILANSDRLAEAVEHYEQAIHYKPNHAEAYNNLGIALARSGHEERAIQAIEQSLTIRPTNVQARMTLAELTVNAGRLEQAELHYKTVLHLLPGDSTAANKLADILARRAHIAGAIAVLRESLRHAPDVPETMGNLAWLLATSADPALRNGPEAVVLAERAVAATERLAPAPLRVLAAAYAAAGRFDDAVRTQREAIALALSRGKHGLAEQLRAALKRYESSRLYRGSP